MAKARARALRPKKPGGLRNGRIPKPAGTRPKSSKTTRSSAARSPKITPAVVAAHGLSPQEYQRIHQLIGRAPSFTELGIFSAMWNEHCSYKSSKIHLRGLPTQ